MKEDHGERQEFAALVQAHSRALFRAARALLDRCGGVLAQAIQAGKEGKG